MNEKGSYETIGLLDKADKYAYTTISNTTFTLSKHPFRCLNRSIRIIIDQGMCRDLVNLNTADCRRKTQYPLQSYMDETAKEVCLLPHEKFRTASLINQSIKIYMVLLKASIHETTDGSICSYLGIICRP